MGSYQEIATPSLRWDSGVSPKTDHEIAPTLGQRTRCHIVSFSENHSPKANTVVATLTCSDRSQFRRPEQTGWCQRASSSCAAHSIPISHPRSTGIPQLPRAPSMNGRSDSNIQKSIVIIWDPIQASYYAMISTSYHLSRATRSNEEALRT
jgi:hypothetical protein